MKYLLLGGLCIAIGVVGGAAAQESQKSGGAESSADIADGIGASDERGCVLTPAQIDRALSPISGDRMKACLDRSAAMDDFDFVPDPKVWVKFDVQTDGSFTNVTITTADYRGSELEKCLATEVQKQSMHDERCPTVKTVKYPFLIYPGHDALEKRGIEPEDPGPPPDLDLENL